MTNAKKGGKGLTIEAKQGESEDHALARFMLSPAVQSAWTLKEYINSPVELDLQALMDCLEKQVDLVKNGVHDSIEQMLLVQAFSLDAIANSLFRRSKCQEYMKQLETHMKLGLRAQSQSRANLEALINMHNPKTHLNQTNIAHGPQQVNNSISAEKGKPPNELLEKKPNEQWLDTRTPTETIRADQELATVGAIDRTEND